MQAQQIRAGVDVGFLRPEDYERTRDAFLHSLDFTLVHASGGARALPTNPPNVPSARPSMVAPAAPAGSSMSSMPHAPAAAAAASGPPPPPPPPPPAALSQDAPQRLSVSAATAQRGSLGGSGAAAGGPRPSVSATGKVRKSAGRLACHTSYMCCVLVPTYPNTHAWYCHVRRRPPP